MVHLPCCFILIFKLGNAPAVSKRQSSAQTNWKSERKFNYSTHDYTNDFITSSALPWLFVGLGKDLPDSLYDLLLNPDPASGYVPMVYV